MSESQKGNSSSINSKEKDSLLDLDLGKDFLSSWKSMSMREDPMDLDFGPVSKGKKKAFSFDKADMDFNIDSDFGKIPSFNIDMPDLDISSPLKKDAKNQDKSNKEPAGGKNKGKTPFTFSLDFNELDGFDFKSSPRKEDIKAKRDEEKENSSNRIGIQNSGDHPADDIGDNGSHEDDISRMPTPEALITPNLDTQVDAGSSLSAIKSFPSKSIPNDNVLLNSEAVADVESHEAITLLENTLSASKQQPDCLVDKSISPEPVSEEASVAIEAIQDVSVHSTSRDKSSQDTVPEFQEEVSSGATRYIESSEKDNGGSQVCSGEGTEPALAELVADKEGNVMNQNSLEHNTKPLNSGLGQTIPSPIEGTTDSNLMPEKQRASFTTRSKYFKQPDKTEDLSKNTSIQTKLSSLSDKVIGSRQPRLVAERKGNVEETQSDTKLTGVSLSNSGVSVIKGHLKIGSQEHYEDLTLNRLLDQDRLKGKPASGGGSKNVKSLDSIRLTGQTDKSTSQKSINSANLVPDMPTLQTVKKSTPEGYKSYSSKGISQMRALCSLKISRTSGANMDSSKLIPQKDRSLKDLDQNVVGSRHPETAQFVETKKQTPLTPSLKRKMIETVNADAVLKPSKRPSELPSNRNSAEISTEVEDKEACSNENMVDGNSRSVLDNSQNSKLDITWEVNMGELEVPFLLENDSNVEKAEACTKELDDICTMLRKKHDEAKEILVRAIVNNNKLLMLNHPLYEEKIRMVQKFALQLTLREVDTWT